MPSYEKFNNRVIIGLYEKVDLLGDKSSRKTVIGRIDTGATRSSIDVKLAASLKLGPVLKTKMVKSAHGATLRPIVEGVVIIAGKKIKTSFTIADRAKMKYKLLIGQDVLKNGEFLVDTCNSDNEVG
ncbi:MAG: RimK/LysX family protein [Candidatus Woesearchaeota archaeon]